MSWKRYFWNFSPGCEKFAVEANRGSIIFDQKTEKIIFFQILLEQTLLFLPEFEFYMKNAFFWCIYCSYSSKIAKLEIFRNFWVKLYYNGNFAIFFCFLQKKFLKMALMNWKWSQLLGRCVFGTLWRSRAKLDRRGSWSPPWPRQGLLNVGLFRVNCVLKKEWVNL